MKKIAAVSLLAGLSACGGTSSDVWACAGQPDLLLTTKGDSLSIVNANTGETTTLAEIEDDRAWATGPVSWRIVALDQALYQTGTSTINCRRPG